MTTPRGRKGQWTLTSWLAVFLLLAAFGLPRAAQGAVCNGAFDILQKGFCSTTTNQGCDTAADCPAGETCKTFNFFDPGDPKANGGNKLRVNLAIGAGSISVGTPPQLTVNRVRFDLACVANSGGPPCTPQPNVVQYGGDATITSNCVGSTGGGLVTWTSTTAQGGNEIVFNASQPILIAQNCSPRGQAACGNCFLEFTIAAQGQEPAGSDATPQIVEEVAGYTNGAGDATCSPTLQSGTGQTADLPICPSCTLDQCNLGCDQTTGTCTPQQASTPCADTDGNSCTTAGCELTPIPGVSPAAVGSGVGVCVQTHMFASNSTPCADTDGNACTACSPAACTARWSCRSPCCTHPRLDRPSCCGSGRTPPARCSPPSCTRCRRCPRTACCSRRTCASARTPPARHWSR